MKRRMLIVLLAFVPGLLSAQGAETFPHAKHAKLFPVCSGCHVGITAGDASRVFPPAAQCQSCHDGKKQKVVVWSALAARGAGLLTFSHPKHTERSADASCASCHGTNGDRSPWMNVGRAAQSRCTSCHTHQASEHYADDNKCATCHRTLVSASALTDAKIAALPKPSSHTRADFAQSHGAAATASTEACATCHARESCARCHVNSGRSPTIASLATDARVARLAATKPAVYPVPSDHKDIGFSLLHGDAARTNTTRCAVCHARPSCATCHVGDGAAKVIALLPDAAEAKGRGVQLRHVATPLARNVIPVGLARPGEWIPKPHANDTTVRRVRVHPAGFARGHGPAAAAEALSCQGCHAQSFCKDCHVGEKVGPRRYHVANFVTGHAAEAYGRDTECSTCHNTTAFCRACHQQSGLASQGNGRSIGYHNAQPQWLLEHGRAARQELNSCASCHQQRYCLQCHSDLGWRVSPHGPNFDARRYANRNRQECLRCHFKDPLAGK